MVQTVDLSASRKPKPDPSAKWGSYPSIATVIAFDPGGTTGWSLITVHPSALVDDDIKVLDNIEQHQHGQVDCGARKGNWGISGYEGISTTGEAAGCADLIALCRAWPGAAVLIEDFKLRQFRKDQDLLSPVRVTAAISQSLWNSNRGFFTQSPGDAKHACTDARLKAWGLYQREGGLEHARDADRHAVFFLKRCKAKPELRAAAWPHLFAPGQPYACTTTCETTKSQTAAPAGRRITGVKI